MNISTDEPYEWRCPAAHSLWISETSLKGWKGKYFRTFIIVGIFILLFHYLLKPLPLKDAGFDIEKVLLSVFFFTLAMTSYAYLVGPYLFRFGRTNYKIDSKGIKVNSTSNSRFYSWKNIVECQTIEMHESLEGIMLMRFYTKQSTNGHALVFDITQNEFATKIYDTIQNNIADKGEVPGRNRPRIMLTKHQHIFMLALSLAGAFLFVFYMLPSLIELDLKEDSVMPLSFMSILFLGPGTWGLFFLFGGEFYKKRNWCVIMMIYNLATLALIPLLMFVKIVHDLSKTFQGQ